MLTTQDCLLQSAKGPEHPTSNSQKTPTWPQAMPHGIGNIHTPCYANAVA